MTDPDHDGAVHSTLRARGLTLGYDTRDISRDLDLEVPAGRITTIVGANACGKSTLLRALARLLKPRDGHVLLDGGDISSLATREVATKLGILPQSPIAPSGISVVDLVARGRYPHQKLVRQWTRDDDVAVASAMAAANVIDLARRPVDQLSGGQRQRVWIALALAQQTDILLLDEPTTYLDLAHQIDVLDLLVDLNRDLGRTIVMVLHDLNHAARYSDHLVAMRDGRIIAEGDPRHIVTPGLVREVLDLDVAVIADPTDGSPHVVPISRHGQARPAAGGRDRGEPDLHANQRSATLPGTSHGKDS
ncbi:MAG: ABC transporter ATP-binding protein [Actinomycetota bacterium]|nr:ABC transporter ATP-binding protein [Actinomycetota bacterium]